MSIDTRPSFHSNFHLTRIFLSLFFTPVSRREIAKNKGRRPNRSGFFHFLLPARAIIRNCLQRRLAIFDSILNRHPILCILEKSRLTMSGRIKIRYSTIYIAAISFIFLDHVIVIICFISFSFSSFWLIILFVHFSYNVCTFIHCSLKEKKYNINEDSRI